MEKQPQGMEMNLELPQDVAEGTYVNLAIIAHSSAEFIIDFARIVPGVPNPKVKHRIILAPEHAKRLLLALQDNISKYEKTFGPIELKTPNLPTNPPNLKV